MKLTYLGHQGWAFVDGNDTVLLDPIYRTMGNGPFELATWPNRELDLEALGPVRAVLLSHEHWDHFSLETLHRISPHDGVWISALSSPAMRTAIEELGLAVHAMRPLHSFSFGQLRMTPMPNVLNRLEVDVVSMLVQGAGTTSFLTPVDAQLHPDAFEWLEKHCPDRTIDNFTNNYIRRSPSLLPREASQDLGLQLLGANLDTFVERCHPRRVLISGQGWAFSGHLSGLNHEFFSTTHGQVLNQAYAKYPDVAWQAPRPGDCYDLTNPDEAPIPQRGIRILPRIDRTFRPDVEPRGFVPYTGVERVEAHDLEEVDAFIRETYGGVLGGHAPHLMAGLYYLTIHENPGRRAEVILRVQNGTGRRVYRFTWSSLRFVPIPLDERVTAESALVVDLWASDLLALVRAEEEAYLVYESSVRVWNNFAQVFDEPPVIEMFLWFAPRFRSDTYLQTYRSKIAVLTEASARVPE